MRYQELTLNSHENPYLTVKFKHEKPILYSFRRCPFAIRTRLILKKCDIQVLLREVELDDKPDCMIKVSPKATVPILVLPNDVLEQSMDIIFWALSCNDPYKMKDAWIADEDFSKKFLHELDNDFKYHLDRYKYSTRFEPDEKILHRNMALSWIEKLDERLSKLAYLSEDLEGIFDYISLPFIRQFRIADPRWFDSCELPNLQKRLAEFERSDLFQRVMQKMPIWKKTRIEVQF